MAAGDDKIVRVRGGSKGFRMITLGKFKAEQKAKKGKLPKIDSSHRAKKMQAKRKKTRQRKKKS
jgi:hypothetical protein